MSWPVGRSVVLVARDVRLLNLVAEELREMGCELFCARDIAGAGELVREGRARRFVLVRIGDDVFSPEQLRRAMAQHLPGYAIRAEETEDRPAGDALQARRQLPN